MVSGEKKGWPNSYKECLPSKNINLNTEVEAKKTNKEKEEEPRIILPRDANGDILFSGFSVLSPTAKLDCQSDLGRVDSINNEVKNGMSSQEYFYLNQIYLRRGGQMESHISVAVLIV